MKKIIMFVVMLVCTLLGFAEEKPIELKENGVRDRFISDEQLQSVFHGVVIEEE